MSRNYFQAGKELINEESKFDVAIIGAGLSGLVAALRLVEADPNLRLIIVEKEDYLGGQLVTRGQGEVGGKWVSLDNDIQPEIRELIEVLKVPMMKVHNAGHWNVLKRHKIRNPLDFIGFELSRVANELDILSGDYNPKCPLRRWQWTMRTYIDQRLYFTESLDYMAMIVRATCGVEPEQIFVHEFLNICFSCGGFTKLAECFLGCENFEVPVHGWTSVVETIYKRLEDVPVNLRLNQSIMQIRDMEKRFALLQTTAGEIFVTKVAIVSCPWQALTRIRFEPRLSPNMVDRIRRRDAFIVSALLQYPAPFWLHCKKTGHLLDYEKRLICYEYAPCTLLCHLYFNSLFDIPIDPGQYCVELLTKHYGIDMLFPIKLELKIFEQAQLIDFPESNFDSDVIIWGSTNSGLNWRGFINGAVQAGNRASVLALNILRPSLISALHIRDIDPATSKIGHTRTSFVQRMCLSINLISVIRLGKVITVGLIGYYCCRQLFNQKIAILRK